jgi:hypothetical protein
MALDVAKLKNVKRRTDGKIIAQCPACAAEGNDSKGEHLAVFPDGRFSCVIHPQDKAHNKIIFNLVGIKGVPCPARPFAVSRFVIPPSVPIMELGRFGRLKYEQQAPVEHVKPPVEQPEAAPVVERVHLKRQRPRKPKPSAGPFTRDHPAYNEMMTRSGCGCADINAGATDEEIVAFLAA